MRPLPPNHGFRTLLLLALTGCASKSPPQADAPESTPATPAPATPETAEAPPPEAPGPDQIGEAPAPGTTRYQACEDWRPGAEATPTSPVDGVALRLHRSRMADPDAGPELTEVKPLCSAAADAAACTAAVAALAPGALRRDMTQMGEFRTDLVWTAGDAVGVVGDRDALVAWLGRVDSAADAQLLVWADGYRPACNEGPHEGDAGWFVQAIKQVNDCPVTTHSYDLRVTPDGAVTMLAEHAGTPSQVCIGRLPPGLDALPEAPGLAAWLVRTAHLEAAAVLAFDQLVRELVHHGAPPALVEAARSAREDEVRHAAIFAALAARAGAEVPQARAEPVAPRSLVEIAADNASEGLVRERFGAAQGLWQARHATDAVLRSAFREVALDEVRHAELSIALDQWLTEQLSPADRARVHTVQAEARAQLAPTDPDPALARVLGLPDGPTARALFARVTAPPSAGPAPDAPEAGRPAS